MTFSRSSRSLFSTLFLLDAGAWNKQQVNVEELLLISTKTQHIKQRDHLFWPYMIHMYVAINPYWPGVNIKGKTLDLIHNENKALSYLICKKTICSLSLEK